MRVTFVRTAGARDRVYVTRDDGGETGWEFPSYGEGLPHDLVHLVVESRFAIAHGVWARVAAGADLGRINAMANRRGGKDKYEGMGGEPEQLLVAEAFANAPWLREDDATVIEAIRAGCAAAGAAAPEVDALVVARVQDELAALRERWRASERATITVEYPLP